MTHDPKTIADAIRAALRQREEVIRDETMGDTPTAEGLGERWFEQVAPLLTAEAEGRLRRRLRVRRARVRARHPRT